MFKISAVLRGFRTEEKPINLQDALATFTKTRKMFTWVDSLNKRWK